MRLQIGKRERTMFWSGGTVPWCFLMQWSCNISCRHLWRLSEPSHWRLWLCNFCSAYKQHKISHNLFVERKMFFACVSRRVGNSWKDCSTLSWIQTSLNGSCNRASCKERDWMLSHFVSWYLVQLCFQRYREPRLVHMLRQGGQQFTELRVLCQILLCNVTQRNGGENCTDETKSVSNVNEITLTASFAMSTFTFISPFQV